MEEERDISKIIWLSDLHFSSKGKVQGHDPHQHIEAAIDHVTAHYPEAECCVLTGDLVDHGTEQDYEALGGKLAALSMPVYPMVGNHDNRTFLRNVLPLPEEAMTNFVQYAADVNDWRFLCLDTQDTGHDSGAFCDARAEWLVHALDEASDRNVILFMHHPPLELGLPTQDLDRMLEQEGFAKAVSGRSNIKHLCFGHVHRPVSGTYLGLPFTTMRSALYQAPPPRPAWDWSTFSPINESPQLGVISLTGSDVVIQFQEFTSANKF